MSIGVGRKNLLEEIQFIIPFLSGILKFGYGTVVACCWSGGCCQCHAPFNVITYYVDY